MLGAALLGVTAWGILLAGAMVCCFQGAALCSQDHSIPVVLGQQGAKRCLESYGGGGSLGERRGGVGKHLPLSQALNVQTLKQQHIASSTPH